MYTYTCSIIMHYEITCLYDFRVYSLVLDNQFKDSSLGKPSFSVIVVPCLGYRPHDISPSVFQAPWHSLPICPSIGVIRCSGLV